MRKTLLLLTLLTLSAFAEHTMFTNQSGANLTQDINETNNTQVFFGDYDDFGKNLLEGTSGSLSQALIGGITNGVSGAGLGAIIGLLDPFVMKLHKDQKYLLVTKMIDSDGNIGFMKTMFIGAKGGKEYSDEEILTLTTKDQESMKGN